MSGSGLARCGPPPPPPPRLASAPRCCSARAAAWREYERRAGRESRRAGEAAAAHDSLRGGPARSGKSASWALRRRGMGAGRVTPKSQVLLEKSGLRVRSRRVKTDPILN